MSGCERAGVSRKLQSWTDNKASAHKPLYNVMRGAPCIRNVYVGLRELFDASVAIGIIGQAEDARNSVSMGL